MCHICVSDVIQIDPRVVLLTLVMQTLAIDDYFQQLANRNKIRNVVHINQMLTVNWSSKTHL